MGMSLITGIDIGRYSIKAVVVKPEKQHFTIVAFHELPVSDAVFSDNHTLNYQDSVKKLKDLKKMLPWMSHKAAMAIPDNAVISKVLQIDASTDDAEEEFAIHQPSLSNLLSLLKNCAWIMWQPLQRAQALPRPFKCSQPSER
ncbi:type IV pilus biogenesis protein PilM [Vibrio astriarenae]|nr:type IV pilus biogenesis protein PilM [Vibrio sp. C7]